MKTVVTIRIFGIPVWSVSRDIPLDPNVLTVNDKESLFKEFKEQASYVDINTFLEYIQERKIIDDANAPLDRGAFQRELTESIFKQLDQAVLNARRGGA